MMPTPSLILGVALFWTLPASGAVLLYRYERGDVGSGWFSMEERFPRSGRLSC